VCAAPKHSAVTLYITVEDVNKVVAKATKLGAKPVTPAADMSWSYRSGTVSDADGNAWMIATHVAEPTPQEMEQKMKEETGGRMASGAA
jgi:PhnB protein